MHKVIALYPPPKDPAHFKKYYEGTHLPLAQQMPGTDLEPAQSSLSRAWARRHPTFAFGKARLPSAAAMGAAMQSPIGQKVAADVANYATGGVTILHFDRTAAAAEHERFEGRHF